MRIVVAGGTGTVGRHVVHAVTEAGHEPVVLSRSGGMRDGSLLPAPGARRGHQTFIEWLESVPA